MASTSRRSFSPLLAGCLLAGPIVPAATAADKLRVLIVDGQNNHDWRMMTPPMKADLEKSGRFTVDVVTTPPAKSPKSAWDAFRPDFGKYDVVLSNYNGEPWPEEVQKALEDYVSKGGGLSIIHAANNSFPAWPAYNKMIGLGWRGPDYGDRVTIDEAGKVVRTPKGEGPGSGHGPQHAFKVVVRDAEPPDHQGHARRMDARHGRALSRPARARPGHADPRHGVLGQGQGGHRHERADDLGHPLRQGPRLHHASWATSWARRRRPSAAPDSPRRCSAAPSGPPPAR